jgi:hypothetical protein
MFLDSEAERLAITKDDAAERDLREIGGKEDSGEIGVVISELQVPIRELAVHADSDVRSEAFAILKKVLQQGLVLPVQCVDQLVALSTDPNARLRAQALGQLTSVNEHYHDYVYQNAVGGTRVAFAFQERLARAASNGREFAVRGHSLPGDKAEVPQAHMSSVYKLLQPKKGSRRSYVAGLVRLFDPSSWGRSPPPTSQELAFVAETLTSLP